MSFFSARNIVTKGMSEAVANDALYAVIEKDCPLALTFLHDKVHEAKAAGQPVMWKVDPASSLGQQITKIYRCDIARELVEERKCHGHLTTFYNCCNGVTPPSPKTKIRASALLQLQMQNGVEATADC